MTGAISGRLLPRCLPTFLSRATKIYKTRSQIANKMGAGFGSKPTQQSFHRRPALGRLARGRWGATCGGKMACNGERWGDNRKKPKKFSFTP